ncbi:M23 family metallopeptidase [Cupriavidus sp. CuC1]|uniref:M23 family metallopeptidase n=1 Tax=Cupriavidus sp. CuC1 TaxID=3373131 RepID=UPI0037D37D56
MRLIAAMLPQVAFLLFAALPLSVVASEGMSRSASSFDIREDVLDLRASDVEITPPIKGETRISSAFGVRIDPVSGGIRVHTGVDLAARHGTPVVAADAGTIAFLGVDKRGYGRYVVVQHAAGYSSWYAHLSTLAKGLHIGTRLSPGQLIGAVGQSGRTTAPHLHFEVRFNNLPIDPLRVIPRKC